MPKKDTAWQEQFISLLSQTCNVTLSAKGAGINPATAYKQRERNKEFAKRWKDAKRQAVELLEAEAWKRARTTSDTLLIFLLKANKPRKYRETQRHEHTGADGGAIKVETTYQAILDALRGDGK